MDSIGGGRKGGGGGWLAEEAKAASREDVAVTAVRIKAHGGGDERDEGEGRGSLA